MTNIFSEIGESRLSQSVFKVFSQLLFYNCFKPTHTPRALLFFKLISVVFNKTGLQPVSTPVEEQLLVFKTVRERVWKSKCLKSLKRSEQTMRKKECSFLGSRATIAIHGEGAILLAQSAIGTLIGCVGSSYWIIQQCLLQHALSNICQSTKYILELYIHIQIWTIQLLIFTEKFSH